MHIMVFHVPLGSVVVRWISANSGLKPNPLFCFQCSCMSACFETLGVSIDPDKISEEMLSNLRTKLIESLH